MVEVQWYGNSDELLLSPSVAFCLPPWIMLNINLVLETCVSISSCFVHEAYVWMKVVTSSNSCASDVSCRHEFEEDCFVSFGIIPNQSCIRAKYSVVRRLATFVLYVSLVHQATDWFVQGKGVGVLILDYAQDSNILDGGSPPELGSVLL